MVRKRTSVLLTVMFFSAMFFSAIPASAQETEYKTTYMIDVRMDGSATWTIEHRVLLKTQEDVEAFENYISQFESQKSGYMDEFAGGMRNVVAEANTATGRSMSAQNFDVLLGTMRTATGTYGIIKYQFDWIGFAEVDEGIMVGDVFVGGLYLSRDDALIIRYPTKYGVETIIPEPDATRGNELVWYGLRDFGSGEPRVVLKPKLIVFSPIWIGIIVLIVIGAFILRKKLAREVMKTDEDQIIELLREAGRTMYQSSIVERTGFSKSKTSALLNAMKQKGIIQKVKKGRENLIRLS